MTPDRLVRRLRGWVYRHGYRPRPGSILHSPSMAMYHSVADAWARAGRPWTQD